MSAPIGTTCVSTLVVAIANGIRLRNFVGRSVDRHDNIQSTPLVSVRVSSSSQFSDVPARNEVIHTAVELVGMVIMKQTIN